MPPPPRGMKCACSVIVGSVTTPFGIGSCYLQMDKTDQAEYPSLRLSQKQHRRQIVRKKKARSYFGKKERLQRKLEAMGKEKENVEIKVVILREKNEALTR